MKYNEIDLFINEYDTFLEKVWDLKVRGMDYKDIAKELWLWWPNLSRIIKGREAISINKLQELNLIINKL